MTRREALKSLAGVGFLASVPHRLLGAGNGASTGEVAALLKYLESHARDDGGYALADQTESHLTPTFAVVGCYHLLGQTPPRRAKLAEFIRTHHPQAGKKPEYELRFFDYQQVQSLIWLGEGISQFKDRATAWAQLGRFMERYESSGQPILQHEAARLLCRSFFRLLLDLRAKPISPVFLENLKARRRANGSFNHTPAADGTDGHVLNTWWGIQAFRLSGLETPVAVRGLVSFYDSQPDTVAWLQQCQLSNGGFTYCPKPTVAGWDDVAYTWAAVRSLDALGAAPKDRAACARNLMSLRQADGGFGDRPGWESNPVATWYALDALAALDALEDLTKQSQPAVFPQKSAPKLPSGLKIFTIQIEAPGNGSPSDAVDLARDLKIDLWTAKNSKPEWLQRVQALAKERGVATRFDIGNEEYGTFFKLPGLGNYSHMSDIVAPSGKDFGPSLASVKGLTWETFRERRLKPLEQVGGRLIWQYGENEELVRILLDDSIERGGYAAISTHHFGNPDFILNQPFLYRYRHHIPFVSLQDAHGNESWWWSENLTGFRTFFLAKEPTWDAWLTALKNNWVCAVRHDVLTDFKTRMYGGAPGVLELVREREAQWKWWGRKPDQMIRPWLAVAVIKPADTLETPLLERGVNLRVRLWHQSTNNGAPKQPVVELVSMSVDGSPVEPKRVDKPGGQRGQGDHYHLVELPDLKPGPHTVTAVARHLESKQEMTKQVQFKM